MDTNASRTTSTEPKKRVGYNPLRPSKNPLRPQSQQNSRNTSSSSIGSELNSINTANNNVSINERIHNAKTIYNKPSTTSVTENTNDNYDPHKTIFIDQNEQVTTSKENLKNDNEVEKLNDDIDSSSKNINEHLNLSRSNAGSTASLSSNPLAPRSKSNNPLAPQSRTPSHSTQNLTSYPIPTTAPVQAKPQSPVPASVSTSVSTPVEAPIQDKPQYQDQTPAPFEASVQDKPQSPSPIPSPAPAPVVASVQDKPQSPSPIPAPAPVEARAQDKPQSQSPSSTPANKSDTNNQNLDTIDLESIMCEYCHEKIIGSMINANKKFYHQKHFICSSCSTSLFNVTFHVIDDNLFCKDCYNSKCGVKCAFCNEYINGEYTIAMGKNWHPNHFCCSECHEPLENGSVKEKNGKVYCNKDYQKLFGLYCSKCKEPINEEYITALEKPWHEKCFVCNFCNEPFSTTSFYELEGLPYCPKHFQIATHCDFCKGKIVDKRIRINDKFYHAKHVFCNKCKNPISNLMTDENDDNNKYFQIKDNNVICKNCIV